MPLDDCEYLITKDKEDSIRLQEIIKLDRIKLIELNDFLKQVNNNIFDFDLVPGVIEFAGKFPPEDVGFISGHFELVEAIKAGKNATEEQIEMREHYIGLGYKNFDIKKANSRIAKIVL